MYTVDAPTFYCLFLKELTFIKVIFTGLYSIIFHNNEIV